ncbi:hypothetical protein M438DRAFT_78527 [Aureobasidium pullulans EXF-150]|uniref:F-box domain-containing protein n=1 Tax=Aureobasidium pullulans EXF-150 TaxID=1043002 RepID=A0A074XH61_AURPU|nr:uncharacterized protein M438DRAFT_78527 [Aureobasidium pullulans EXF-150]KEQ81387.1 hypothetical protein M438DRAFT_78527 [Aureobasidium pullulans EXF-150]
MHQREGKRLSPKLRHLATQISSQGARILFEPVLSRLTSLTIGLLNSKDVWFSLIGRLTTFRSLIIHSSVKKFASPHFEAPGNLHALEKPIVSLPMDPGEDKVVTDEQFSTLTSGMPLLRSLEFKFRLRLSLTASTSVAVNCPLLEVCRLSTPVDITAWTQTKAPVFPALQVLHLPHWTFEAQWWMEGGNRLDPSIATYGSEEAHQLSTLCPKLQYLRLACVDYGKHELEQYRKVRKPRSQAIMSSRATLSMLSSMHGATPSL